MLGYIYMTCAGTSNALISQPGSEYYTFELTRLLLIQSTLSSTLFTNALKILTGKCLKWSLLFLRDVAKMTS